MNYKVGYQATTYFMVTLPDCHLTVWLLSPHTDWYDCVYSDL